MNKGTYNKDALIKYCDENNIYLINDYNNLKITRDTIIEGKCINGCINIFKKNFRNLKNYGGYCDICTINNKNMKYKMILVINIFLFFYDIQIVIHMV